MAKSAILKLACVVLMCMVLIAQMANAQVTCGMVVNNLMPCVSYVQYGGSVTPQCCNGIRNLYGAAKAKADRQAVCTCLRNALNGISYNAHNVELAAGLPGKCGVNIPYKISPSINCASVQ